MLSKIDKHHVDCDKIEGSGGTWTQEQTVTVPSYHDILIKDGADLVIINGSGLSGLTLDAGNARNLGTGNKCGLPCTSHPFSVGDIIRIDGSDLYDMEFEVQAETSTHEIVVVRVAGFAAETFDGTESVVRFINDAFAPDNTTGYPVVIGDYMYAPLNNNQTFDSPLAKVSMTDYSVDSDFFGTPTPAYGASEKCTAVCATSDNLYLITNQISPSRILKFQVSDGAFVWSKSLTSFSSYDIAVDSVGRTYRSGPQNPSTGSYEAVRVSADGTSLEQFYDVAATSALNVVLLDEDNDKVYFFGTQSGTAPSISKYPFYRFDIDTRAPEKSVSITGMSNNDVVYTAQMYNGEIYALIKEFTYNGETKNIFVLNSDLEVQRSLYVDTPAILWFSNEYLYVAKNSASYVGDDTITYYNPDTLELVGTINAGSVQSNSNPLLEFDGVVNYGTFATWVAGASEQNRTIAYPEDWAHLEGQTVQVVKDGIYLGDEAVSGGQITLDD